MDSGIYFIFNSNLIGFERELFFRRSLQTLNNSAVIGFDCLRDKCVEIHSKVASLYPNFSFVSLSELQDLPVHQYSRSLMPADASNMMPLTCIGDGNCLYRYV